MDVLALPMCFVVLPLALVDIAVSVVQLAVAMGFVIEPGAFITGSVLPDLGSPSVPLVTQPLPSVFGPTLQGGFWFLRPIGFSLPTFLLIEIHYFTFEVRVYISRGTCSLP